MLTGIIHLNFISIFDYRIMVIFRKTPWFQGAYTHVLIVLNLLFDLNIKYVCEKCKFVL